MIQDLTISYIRDGIKTILTLKDDCLDNMPYNIAKIFEKVIEESEVNPQIVIDDLKDVFEYE